MYIIFYIKFETLHMASIKAIVFYKTIIIQILTHRANVKENTEAYFDEISKQTSSSYWFSHKFRN